MASRTQQDIVYGQVAKELSIPVKIVRKCYEAYWYYIKAMIEKLPLKCDKNFLTEEEFNKLQVNFVITELGRLYCKYSYKKLVQMDEYIKQNKQKRKTSKKTTRC